MTNYNLPPQVSMLTHLTTMVNMVLYVCFIMLPININMLALSLYALWVGQKLYSLIDCDTLFPIFFYN